jgi:dienelactone hydrolase
MGAVQLHYMKSYSVLFLPLVIILPALLLGQSAKDVKVKAPVVTRGHWSDIQFTESPPQSGADQLMLRMRSKETPLEYDIAQEHYDVLVPKTYTKEKPHGLFIWISPGDKGVLPEDWDSVLAKHKLIAISARNSGNQRDIFDRMRLAIDANHNLRALFNVDGRRVYVSGFSGGGRVASNLGVTYAEMFSGAACFMGVNFYEPIIAENNEVYQARYIPVDEILDIAKQSCRYSLITGEKDFNLANTKAVHDAMGKAGFKAAQLLTVPALGHQMPKAEWLEKAVMFLDQGK